MSLLEYRKIQEIENKGFTLNFTLNLPIQFCRNLGFKKHDLLSCKFENDRIVVSKAIVGVEN
jgi:hypothetical protein